MDNHCFRLVGLERAVAPDARLSFDQPIAAESQFFSCPELEHSARVDREVTPQEKEPS
jgi:hypothetical protein